MCKIGCLDLIFFYYLVLISSCFLIISCFVENCSIFNWVSFCFFQPTVITWNEALIWNKSLSNCISWKCGVKNIQVITYCKKPKLGTMYQVWLQSTKQFSIPMLAQSNNLRSCDNNVLLFWRPLLASENFCFPLMALFKNLTVKEGYSTTTWIRRGQ